MSLPRCTYLCHLSLPNNICQVPNLLPGLRQIACNHRGIIQTRCEYHGGFLGHFCWTDARVSRIELSLWKMRSSIILSPEHPQNDEWLKLLGKTQILPEKLILEGCWPVKSFLLRILSFCILFWDHISSFNETCLFFVSLLFWKHEMFSLKVILTKYFDQAPTCD